MRIDRKELLQRLLCVEVAVSTSKTISQSNCVVLRNGRFYTMSHELAASISSKLPKEIEAAIPLDKLLQLLKLLTDVELDISVNQNNLVLSGKGKTKIALMEEISLPVGSVELPKDWKELPEQFSEAVLFVKDSTKKKDDYLKECIHLHPNWLQASDATKAARWKLPNFVTQQCLARAEALKEMANLGMTHASETEAWLHFKNPYGLRLSVKKETIDDYPPLDDYFQMRGDKIVFPKNVILAAEQAGVFKDDKGHIRVTLNQDSITVVGTCADGEHIKTGKIEYKGQERSFSIPANLLPQLIQSGNRCEVTQQTLRLKGKNFIFAACLESL